MTTTPQAAQNPLLKRCYTMSEPHLSGYRVVIGFERLEDAQDAHEYIAKLKATQEPVQSVPEAMKVVTEAMRSDPDYAWSWHCSVAMASVDEGMGHYEANQAAARFMRLLAGVDTTKHQGFPEAPKKEPVQAGELLLQGGLTNEQLREAFGEKTPGVVPSDRDLTLFALGIEVGAAELADERRMKKMYFDERNSARDAWRRAADQREEARATLSARKPLTPLIARQLGEWHEDDGPVMWWAWNGHGWAGEPAWCGQPTDSDWPGYHTHWTPHPQQPAINGIGLEVKP